MKNIQCILTLMVIDLKLVLKNIFFWVLLGVLIAIIIAIHLLLPKTIEWPIPDLVTYGVEDKSPEYQSVDTMEKLQEQLNQDNSRVGVVYEDGNYTVLGSHYSQKQGTAVVLPFLEDKEEVRDIRISQITDTVTPQPFNKRSLPVFICFEAVIQGFLLGGVLMLNEKEGKIVSALQISPIGTGHYWTAKIVLFSIIGTLYALILALFTVGVSFPVLPFIFVSMVASALFTMMGMITAVFFRSMNNWFMLASLILGVNMLTMFAYIFPSLTLSFMKFIPSYPFIFFYEHILFGHIEWMSDSITVMIWSGVLTISSVYCIKNVFLRPQKGV